MKILGFFPAVVAKHEINSVFVQSLTVLDSLSLADFQYALFLLFYIDLEKQGKASNLIQEKKLMQKLSEFFFSKEGGLIQGESVVTKIREYHNNIVLNQINNKTFFGKHYSVNIKASIM